MVSVLLFCPVTICFGKYMESFEAAFLIWMLAYLRDFKRVRFLPENGEADGKEPDRLRGR